MSQILLMQVLKRLLASLFGPGTELDTAEEQACRHLLAVAAAAIDDRWVSCQRI